MANAATVDFGFFDAIQASMEAEMGLKENLRSAVRDLDRINRNIASVLNQVHSSTKDKVPALLVQAKIHYTDIQERIQTLSSLIPENQYFKYNNLWSHAIQQACFFAALITYLEHERLISIDELEGFLAVKVDLTNTASGMQIGLDDFLLGVISLASELSRLAVNAVTSGDFSRPVRINKFLKELYSGFQLLNMKNDSLRKRFDGIKYDIKKVEEIIYDLTVRNLIDTGVDTEQEMTIATA